MVGGWLPFAISLILAFIMFGWYHGRQKKLAYELSHKIDVDQLQSFLLEPEVRRVPGLCFFYTKFEEGLPPILGHYVKNMKCLHSVTIFTTLRYLLVPKVSSLERVVVRKMGIEGVYGCVIHYGYVDALDFEGDLVCQVVESLKQALLTEQVLSTDPVVIQAQIAQLEAAKQAEVVHIRGRTSFHMDSNSNWFDRIILRFYEVMHKNCRPALPPLDIPLTQQVEVGMLYEA